MTTEAFVTDTPPTTRSRMPLRAIGLVVGAVAFATADLGRRIVLPDGQVSGIPDMVRRVQAHSGLWLALGLAVVLGSVAMLPGILAAMRASGDRSRAGRGRRTILIGGGLVFVGLVASVAHALAFYGMAAIDGTSGAPMPAVQAMEDASNSYPLFVLVIVAFIVGMALGPIVLTWGLRRAGAVPIWVPVAALVFAVTGTVSGPAAGVVGLIAAVLTFAMVARTIVR